MQINEKVIVCALKYFHKIFLGGNVHNFPVLKLYVLDATTCFAATSACKDEAGQVNLSIDKAVEHAMKPSRQLSSPTAKYVLNEISALINEDGLSTQSSSMTTCESGEDIQAIVHGEVGGSDEKRCSNVVFEVATGSTVTDGLPSVSLQLGEARTYDEIRGIIHGIASKDTTTMFSPEAGKLRGFTGAEIKEAADKNAPMTDEIAARIHKKPVILLPEIVRQILPGENEMTYPIVKIYTEEQIADLYSVFSLHLKL